MNSPPDVSLHEPLQVLVFQDASTNSKKLSHKISSFGMSLPFSTSSSFPYSSTSWFSSLASATSRSSVFVGISDS